MLSACFVARVADQEEGGAGKKAIRLYCKWQPPSLPGAAAPPPGADGLPAPAANIAPFCFPLSADSMKRRTHMAAEVRGAVRVGTGVWGRGVRTSVCVHGGQRGGRLPQETSDNVPRPTKQVHCFTLTDGDGSRLHGFCRQFLPPGESQGRGGGGSGGGGPRGRYPQVLCVVSRHAWLPLMYKVLEVRAS